MNLTTEQNAILAHNGCGSLRIIAGAGAGKTTTTALFVKEAVMNGHCKESQVMFITFTRLASREISHKLATHLGHTSTVSCGTFHKIMFLLLKKAGIAMASGGGLYDESMERGVQFFLEQMSLRTPALVAILQQYQYLIVDEFQDVDIEQFTFIKLFREIQPTLRIVAIGDLAQNIYRFRGTSNEFLRRLLQSDIVPDITTLTLTTNFRSNPAILACVNTVFAPEITMGHVLHLVAGRMELPAIRPCYYEYARSPGGGIGEYEILVANTLVSIIQNAKAAGKSVALIFPAVRCSSYTIIMMALNNKLGSSIDFHRISKEDATSSIVDIVYDPCDKTAPVQCATIHASKGLEWDIVAFINTSDSMYIGEPTEAEDDGFIQERTNQLYVGMTRAGEQLHVFANANCDGRNRILARCGEDTLCSVFDITVWGEDKFKPRETRRMAPIGVTQLIKRLPQYPDLLKRIQACSETIPSTFHNGVPLPLDKIYKEMRMRNREAAFGTFVDWKIKKAIASADNPTRQCRLLEVLYYMKPHNWFHRDTRFNTLAQMEYVLSEFFERAKATPQASLTYYMESVRILASYFSSKFFMCPEVWTLFGNVERHVLDTYKKETLTLRDEYVLAQSYSLYAQKQHCEIMSSYTEEDSYGGLPAGFDVFAAVAVAPAVSCLKAVTSAEAVYRVDVPVETESLLFGELDVVVDGIGIIEIKCGGWTERSDLRGQSSCMNLIQLLTYVSMGRHGTLPFPCQWAMLLNPLTGTWERYDITAWAEAGSLEFLACLEELRERLNA